MRTLDRLLLHGCLGMGLIAGTAALSPAADWGFRHHPDSYAELRNTIDRTQNDLRMAADLDPRRNDNRYKNAQGHLSTFDRKLIKGKWDNGELDKALNDIRDILNKNVLQASMRDNLMRDATDLKVARDRR